MGRRFGDDARVVYRNIDDASIRAEFEATVTEIETRGLLYPVTVIDGAPLYDGAVSYPAIMRAVTNKLADRETAQT
ncbi:MAG: hypothetical protein WCJ13_05240 [Coriobacteriia bacterium]